MNFDSELFPMGLNGSEKLKSTVYLEQVSERFFPVLMLPDDAMLNCFYN